VKRLKLKLLRRAIVYIYISSTIVLVLLRGVIRRESKKVNKATGRRCRGRYRRVRAVVVCDGTVRPKNPEQLPDKTDTRSGAGGRRRRRFV